MRHRRIAGFLVLLILAVAVDPATQGQTVRSVYAIRDAKIYTVSGPAIPRGTIVHSPGNWRGWGRRPTVVFAPSPTGGSCWASTTHV